MKISLRTRLIEKLRRVGARFRRQGERARSRLAGVAILSGAFMFVGPAAPASAVELLQNGSFEMNNGFDGDNSGFGWQNPNDALVFDVYSYSTQVYYEGVEPDGSDDWYFHTVGITNPNGIYQDVDLLDGATPAQIDAGTVSLTFTAYLAGYTPQNDHPRLELQLFDGVGEQLGSAIVFDGAEFGEGSNFLITASGLPFDDPSITNPLAVWKLYGAGSGVFVGARSARVTIFQDTMTGNGNDNYVDLVGLDVTDTGQPQFLSLEVNTNTGEVSMFNPTSQSIDINFYEIFSANGSLDTFGWNSFDDQNLDAFGNGPGQSWDEGGESDASEFTEGFWLGSSTISAGGRETLGRAYNAQMNSRDLRFSYGLSNNTLVPGLVQYVTGGLVCDFDGNGACDTVDIDSLVAQGDLVAGVAAVDPKFDLTGDGNLNQDDITVFLAEAGTAAGFAGAIPGGDADLNGVVNSSDLNAVGINWLASGKVYSEGDFNGDGQVTAADLNILGVNWLADVSVAAAAQSVPEPSGVLLVGLAGIAALLRRR